MRNTISTYTLRLALLAMTAAGILWSLPAAAQMPIACPATATEWQQRCRTTEADAARIQAELGALEAVMTDPNIILVKADRIAGEGSLTYKARVERNAGVRSPVTDTWLPILGHYYLPDIDTALVAMVRTDYWRYIGEALGFDTPEARAAFQSQEALGLKIRQSRFLGPGGRIEAMRSEWERLQDFVERCCGEPPETMPIESPAPPLPAPLIPDDRPAPPSPAAGTFPDSP